jgi:hypothetical protein
VQVVKWKCQHTHIRHLPQGVVAERGCTPSWTCHYGGISSTVTDSSILLLLQVKAAILKTLAIMITQGGIALKPFLPQLQTTFVKCLSDPAKAVRERAAKALGLLMALQPRVDPVVGDLCASAASAPDAAVRHSMLVALQGTLKNAGKTPALFRVASGSFARSLSPHTSFLLLS